MEIEVGFREGVVPSSALLALYRYRVAYSLWSVWHSPYLLALIFFSSNESGFDRVRGYTLPQQVRTFDLGFIDMRCIFLPVSTAIGSSASDSRPDFHSLFCTIILTDR